MPLALALSGGACFFALYCASICRQRQPCLFGYTPQNMAKSYANVAVAAIAPPIISNMNILRLAPLRLFNTRFISAGRVFITTMLPPTGARRRQGRWPARCHLCVAYAWRLSPRLFIAALNSIRRRRRHTHEICRCRRRCRRESAH